MAGIDIRRFFNNFNPNRQILAAQKNIVNSQPQSQPQSSLQPKMPATEIIQSQTSQNLQMNTLKSIDRSIYAKDLMGVPKNINEFIYMIQRGMTQQQFNQMFSSQLALQKNSLSQLQAQILAQLQGFDLSGMKDIVNKQLTAQLQSSLKNLEILSNGMINLNQISELIQANGKNALTKIIMSMTEASKMGITDLTQMKDMAKFINASIAIASEKEPAQTLKLLLLLYLPWLPLKDGVDFELEINTNENSQEESDSILTVTITTINYGTVVATLFLETSNSVQVVIQCGETFPKDELELRLEGDKKHYSMDTVASFEIRKDLKSKDSQKAKADINMSQTTEINPYLLLTAHSLIKHVIDIDNNASIGIISHTDMG
ncbi:hypothetical protein J6G99_03670 [bacterium]|nr:hypothetical protein [bacterium]